MTDDQLLGWLIVVRYNMNWNEDLRFPKAVQDGLKARGWVEDSEDTEPWRDDRAGEVTITDAGTAASDMACEEWGVELDFEEVDG